MLTRILFLGLFMSIALNAMALTYVSDEQYRKCMARLEAGNSLSTEELISMIIRDFDVQSHRTFTRAYYHNGQLLFFMTITTTNPSGSEKKRYVSMINRGLPAEGAEGFKSVATQIQREVRTSFRNSYIWISDDVIQFRDPSLNNKTGEKAAEIVLTIDERLKEIYGESLSFVDSLGPQAGGAPI